MKAMLIGIAAIIWIAIENVTTLWLEHATDAYALFVYPWYTVKDCTSSGSGNKPLPQGGG